MASIAQVVESVRVPFLRTVYYLTVRGDDTTHAGAVALVMGATVGRNLAVLRELARQGYLVEEPAANNLPSFRITHKGISLLVKEGTDVISPGR